MFQKIILPLDGSAESARAIGVATCLAQRMNVALHIVSLHGPDGDTAATTARINDQIGATGDVVRVIDVYEAPQPVADELRSVATAAGESAIVMASHGRGRSAALLGSVANDLLSSSERPVVMVGPQVSTTSFRCHGPLIVAIAGQDDHAVLDLTTGLLAETDFDPFVAHVMNLTASREYDIASSTVGGDLPTDSVTAQRAAHRLEQSSTRNTVDFDVFHGDHPAETLVAEAKARSAAMIVMATHARHGMDRLAHGSITADVVRNAPCPVLAVGMHG